MSWVWTTTYFPHVPLLQNVAATAPECKLVVFAGCVSAYSTLTSVGVVKINKLLPLVVVQQAENSSS